MNDAAVHPASDVSANEQWLSQQRAVLSALLQSCSVRPIPGTNWLHDLHSRVTSLLPSAFLQLYTDREPSAAERAAISEEGPVELQPYRERGSIVACAITHSYRWYAAPQPFSGHALRPAAHMSSLDNASV